MGFRSLPQFIRAHFPVVLARAAGPASTGDFSFDVIVVDVPNVWDPADPYERLAQTLDALIAHFNPKKRVYLLLDSGPRYEGCNPSLRRYAEGHVQGKAVPKLEFLISDSTLPGNADFKVVAVLSAEYQRVGSGGLSGVSTLVVSSDTDVFMGCLCSALAPRCVFLVHNAKQWPCYY
eukprot:RCo009547